MKLVTSRHAALAMCLGLLCLLGLFVAACLGGCKALDDYDRSYSLSLSDGQHSASAGVAIKPRKPYANEQRVPPSLHWRNPDLVVP